MTRRLNIALAVLVLLFGVPYYWYFLDNSTADAPAKHLDIAELRRLAASMPGEAPDAVEVDMPGFRRLPGNLLVAGSGIKRKLVSYMSFRLPVRGGKPVVIESGLSKKVAHRIGAEQFKPEIQAQVDRNLVEAGLILVTHEHRDHLGALAERGGTPLAQAAWLNSAQLAAPLDWPNAGKPQPRLSGTAPQAVAPGVVVIPAPDSHSAGSQLIFVRLASGREFLFVGDVASFAQNWQELRGRSRFIETWVAPDNRAEVFAWLKAIRELKAKAPGLTIVPGHDYEWLQDPLNQTGVKIGYSLTVP